MKNTKSINVSAVFYFLACTCILPFAVNNKYFDMLEAKAIAYFAIAAVTLLILLLHRVISSATKKGGIGIAKRGFNGLDVFVILFSGFSLVSCFLSEDIKAALFGSDGWGMGGIIIAVMAAGYFLLSRANADYGVLWCIAAAANILVFTVSIFHSASVDLFGMHKGILESQYFWYISTIGNINWLVGYLCLLLPIFFTLFVSCDRVWENLLYGAVSILGCINIVLSASDGIYLGMGFFALFFAAYLLKNDKRTRKGLCLLAAFGLSLAAVDFLPCFAAKKADLDGLSKFIVTSHAGVYITAASAVLFCVMCILKSGARKHLRKVILIAFEVLSAVIIAVAVFYCIAVFDKAWGHSRGMIWISSLGVYKDFPLFRQILGCGTDMLGNYLTALTESFKRPVLNAHNEFIEYLLTGGIIGAVSYVGMYVSALVGFIRGKVRSQYAVGYMLALSAYFAQAAVNNPQATNYALLFIVFALLRKSLGRAG